MNEKKPCLVIYRGPMETSRIIFIVSTLKECYSDIRFVWVFPGAYTVKVQTFFEQLTARLGLHDARVLNHRLSKLPVTVRAVQKLAFRPRDYDLVLIGVSAAIFGRVVAKPRHTLWFINGIPEEAGLQSGVAAAFSAAQWRLFTLCVSPALIVTVSSRMSAHVARYFSRSRFAHAPTCVDTSVFRHDGVTADRKNGLCVYLGTGAAWQALDKLNELWQALHRLEPALRFRVVSRDPRTRVLAAGLPAGSVEFVQSNQTEELGALLRQAEIGFLIRENHVVNRVSFPTKFGEQVAAGCWMVVSDIDWDVSDYVRKFNVGLVLNNELPVQERAKAILAYRETIDWVQLAAQTVACARQLSRSRWIPEIAGAIRELQR